MAIDGVGLTDVSAAHLPPATATTAGDGEPASAVVATLADRVSIQPLDIVGALQILLAEVKAEFSQLLTDVAAQATPGSPASSPAVPLVATPSPNTLPPLLVGIFLQLVPVNAISPAVWLGNVAQIRGTLDAALNKAIDAVSGWQQVPEHVVASVKEVRAAVVAALDDDPPNACWLRPEWASLASGMQHFWRRRRRLRRLLDPDADWLPDPDDTLRE